MLNPANTFPNHIVFQSECQVNGFGGANGNCNVSGIGLYA